MLTVLTSIGTKRERERQARTERKSKELIQSVAQSIFPRATMLVATRACSAFFQRSIEGGIAAGRHHLHRTLTANTSSVAAISALKIGGAIITVVGDGVNIYSFVSNHLQYEAILEEFGG